MIFPERAPTEMELEAIAQELERLRKRGLPKILVGLSAEQEHATILACIEEARNLLFDAARLGSGLSTWSDQWEQIHTVYTEVTKLSERISNGPLPGFRMIHE